MAYLDINSTREQRTIFQGIDPLASLLCLLLACIGWTMVYSAEYNDAHPSLFDMSQNYGKQMLWIGTAAVLACIVVAVTFRVYETLGNAIYLIGILALLSTFVLGTEIKGSHSWIKIGTFSVQPAEFAKFTTCLFLAHYLGNMEAQLQKLQTKLTAIAIIALPAIIIILQNETGSALVYAALAFVLYREGLSGGYLLVGFAAIVLAVLAMVVNEFILIGILVAAGGIFLAFSSPMQRRQIWLPAALLALAGSLLILSVDYAFHNILEDHQRTRINVLLGTEYDPRGAGYNVHQSMIAIGSGGFFGKGFLQGTQTKYDYVPEQSTDFIFCTVGEEFGFLGCLVLLGIFAVLITRIILLAERQPNAFARVYGYGVASILLFHVIVNIGMTIGLMPVIGIPLPFVSYGGSSLWSFTVLVFVFLKLDASRKLVLR